MESANREQPIASHFVSMSLIAPFPTILLAILIGGGLIAITRPMAVVACLMGASTLLSARATQHGMRALEIQQPGSVTLMMRLRLALIFASGVLIMAVSGWRAAA